jgi:hypothetical protein
VVGVLWHGFQRRGDDGLDLLVQNRSRRSRAVYIAGRTGHIEQSDGDTSTPIIKLRPMASAMNAWVAVESAQASTMRARSARA